MSLSKVQFEKEVNSSLRKFADQLKAPEDFYDKGIKLCERVRQKVLSVASSYNLSIASTFYAGSIGKHTELQNPDFDIVMKINNQLPPFEQVLQVLERILQKHSAELEISPRTIHLTPYSIQFTFTNGMQVDLLPAAASLTVDQVLEKMKKNPKYRRYYSSSLVEQQVEFMKQQGAFAHAVVRLAKHWFKSMDFGGTYISGGSTIFELLAVAAVILEKGQPESMINAFLRVIGYVENFDRLQLAFQKGYGGWQLQPAGMGGHRPPYLIEPSNPTKTFWLE